MERKARPGPKPKAPPSDRVGERLREAVAACGTQRALADGVNALLRANPEYSDLTEINQQMVSDWVRKKGVANPRYIPLVIAAVRRCDPRTQLGYSDLDPQTYPRGPLLIPVGASDALEPDAEQMDLALNGEIAITEPPLGRAA